MTIHLPAVSAILCLIAPLHAATTTQPLTLTPQNIAGPISFQRMTDISPAVTVPLDYARFDSNSGILNSVRLTFAIEFLLAGTGDATGIGLSGGVNGFFFVEPVNSFYSAGDGTSTPTGAGPNAVHSVPFTVFGSRLLDATHSSFSFFSAPGGGSDQIRWVQDQNFLNANNTENARITLTGGTAQLEYDFTPVPEPAALALFAIATGGLLVRRRR